MSVIGIDYGNLDCVVAQAKRGGIDIILNENSNRKNPNMICMQGKQRLIGEAAVSVARMHFKNTATNIKRLIGLKYNHPDVQEELKALPFQTTELPNGNVGIILNYDDTQVTFSCEQVVAMMLAKLQSIAAAANGGVTKSDTVISVPGYFDDAQRRAMLSASEIAGINCLRMINEHTAIALAYGIYKSARNLFHESEPQHVMFIDMGHSSYTVSVVAFVQGKLQVKSAVHDRSLGGRNFDSAIAEHVNEEFKAKTKQDALANPKARMKLMAAAEKAKKNLSPQGVTATNLSVECLVDEFDYNGKLQLEKFEELIADLLQRLEGPVVDALKQAGIEKTDLKYVEIVGGATRVASVKHRLADLLGLDKSKPNLGLSTTLNADECVARGCALASAILSPLFKVKDFSIADIVTYPIRLSWDGASTTPMDTAEDNEDEEPSVSTDDNSIVIFDRTDDFPKTKRITFRRSEAFEVRAEYDNSAAEFLPKDSIMSLGTYKVSGIPAKADDEDIPRIRFNVRQDLNGIFGVASCQLMQEIKEEAPPAPQEKEEGKAEEKKDEESVPEPKKKRFRKVDLQVEAPALGLNKQTVTEFVEKELQMAQQDRIIEETNNKRNELESYVYDMRTQLGEQLASYVSSEDKDAFEAKLNEIEDWLYTDEGFDSTKSVYAEKLNSLHVIGNPIVLREEEATELPAAKAELLKLIEEMKQLVNSNDAAYAHWSDADCEILRKESSEAESWLYDQLATQSELPSHQDPVLKSTDVRQRGIDMHKKCQPVLTKPKPAPKPEPTPEAKTEGKEESKETKDEGMDLD